MAGIKSDAANSFEWRCEHFAELDVQKLYSPVYTVGKFQWRILVFPRGLRAHNDISVFVDVADADTLPPRWHREARFAFDLVNHVSPSKTLRKDGSHAFCASERDRGFTELTEGRRDEILDPKNGFVDKDGALTFRCEVDVVWDGADEADSDDETEDEQEVRVDWRYDSKAVTGFVGLANQGATCYLNSLVQALYHLPAFRALVYSLDDEDLPNGNNDVIEAPSSSSSSAASVVRALQRLFFRLERSSRAVETLELTRSFGWTSADSFVQHDVQEMLRVLSERLEQRSARAKSEVQRLFRGRLENRIECVNVDYTSSRIEDFYDLSLNVKGCPTIEHALSKYCEDELMTGTEKYQAPEPYGLQDARKGIRFLELPPVLHLHLKRFELDPYGDGYLKVHDRQAYPLELDLSPHLAPGAPRDPPSRYHLHGVLVHRGQVQSGHYYAFLRPTRDAQWYKFDDSTVVKASSKRALQDNFGGIALNRRSAATAYMLIYLREHERDSLLETIGMPQTLRSRLESAEQREQEEARAREEARTQIKLYYVTDDVMREHTGADLSNAAEVSHARVPKDSELRALLVTLWSTEGSDLRVWDWVRRQNKSQRPDAPFSSMQMAQRVGTLDLTDGALWVWLERPPHTVLAKGEVLIFVKWYDAGTRALKPLGRVPLPKNSSLTRVGDYARQVRKLAADVPLAMFEEVSARRVDSLNPTTTLDDAELSTGDIVICQLLPTPFDKSKDTPQTLAPSASHEELLTARDYLQYLRKRRQLKLVSLESPTMEFTVEARTDRSLTSVCTALSEVAHVDPLRIVLTGAMVDDTTTPPSTIPRSQPHEFAHTATLKAAARNSKSAPDLLFFELLPEGCTRDSLKSGAILRIRVFIREHPNDLVSTMKSRILYGSRTATIGTLVEPVSPAIPGENTEIQLIATSQNRLSSRYKAEQLCSELEALITQSDVVWIVERVPCPRSDDEILVTCSHARPPSNLHHTLRCWGFPFFILIKSSDSLSEFAERLRLALGANKGEFSTWKLGYEIKKDSLEGVVAMDNALSHGAPGSAWSFVSKGHGSVVILHHHPERADSHTRAVKIQ